MYLEACLQKRRHSLPFVAFVDGLLGVNSGDKLKRIFVRLAKNWGNPTQGHEDKLRVWLPLLWCRLHTSASGVPGCWHKISACSACSGRTAPDWTSSDRHVGKNPKLWETSTLNHPTKILVHTAKAATDTENLKVSTCRQPVELTRPNWAQFWPYITGKKQRWNLPPLDDIEN